MWSKVIGRNKTLRLTDLEGGANVSMLLYNAYEKQERYNMPDTLKGQYTFFLTTPYCVHSDMGRIFCSITRDDYGWHDTVCGITDAATIKEKYGEHDYQEARNDYYRNGRECFLIELSKWGLSEKDIVPNLNFFSKVVADENGNLRYVPEAKAGASLELRFEMDTLVVLNTCPHPLDDRPAYAPKPVSLEVFASAAPTADDPCRNSRPENQRAFQNTEEYNALRF